MARRNVKRTDSNQKEIVAELRKLGISVSTQHDDILVGYAGKTFWYELKQHRRSNIQESQTELLDKWQGHYKIVWTLQMILSDIGYEREVMR